MSPSEVFLGQLEKTLTGITGAIASAIVRRRMPSDVVLQTWARRLRKAAEMIEAHLHGS